MYGCVDLSVVTPKIFVVGSAKTILNISLPMIISTGSIDCIVGSLEINDNSPLAFLNPVITIFSTCVNAENSPTNLPSTNFASVNCTGNTTPFGKTIPVNACCKIRAESVDPTLEINNERSAFSDS